MSQARQGPNRYGKRQSDAQPEPVDQSAAHRKHHRVAQDEGKDCARVQHVREAEVAHDRGRQNREHLAIKKLNPVAMKSRKPIHHRKCGILIMFCLL